jgi:hypothetical protein
MKIPIPKPCSGGLILSYRCSAACRHCMYACSPRWDADWITEEDLGALLSQLAPHIEPAPYGPDSISLSHGLHFSGGEPGLNFELLYKAVEIADTLRIPSTFMETNAAWCTEDTVAEEKLAELKGRGLKGIMISVNPFYAEFVPFSRTERCIRASLDIFGHTTIVYQAEYYRRFRQWGLRDRVPFEQYLEMESSADVFRNVEFFISGRAPYSLGHILGRHFPRFPAARLCAVPCSPPFLRQWHNHFDNYGNYMPGFCGGISFGDYRRLDRLLAEGIDTDRKPVLGSIAAGNFKGLLDFACQQGYRESDGGYFSKCHLCIDIRKHLVTAGTYEELAPRQFYEHVDADRR